MSTPRYNRQPIRCEHCNGTGEQTVTWEEYVYLNLPDRIREGIERLNKLRAGQVGMGTVGLDDIARSARIPISTMNDIMESKHYARLSELYAIADALDVKITDLLPITQ